MPEMVSLVSSKYGERLVLRLLHQEQCHMVFPHAIEQTNPEPIGRTESVDLQVREQI